MAQSMTKNATSKRLSKQVKSGKSNITGFGGVVAKARKAAQTRNGPKMSETDHLQPDLFKGKHHAPSNATSVRKNNAGDTGRAGRHEAGSGKHSGVYNKAKDVAQVVKRGATSMGKHSKSYV